MIEISLQLVYIGSFNRKSQSIQSLGRKESFSIFSRYPNFTTHIRAMAYNKFVMYRFSLGLILFYFYTGALQFHHSKYNTQQFVYGKTIYTIFS